MRPLWTMTILFVPGSNWWNIWHVFVCCELSEPPRTHQGSIYLQQNNQSHTGIILWRTQRRTKCGVLAGGSTNAYMHTHVCIHSSLTLALGPSIPRAISWATVCSRRLLSSACCRRSLISSRVSSSGCTQQHTEGGRRRAASLTSTAPTNWLRGTTGANTMLVFSVLTSERVPTFDMWLGETEHSAPTRTSDTSKPVLTLQSHCWLLCVWATSYEQHGSK